MSKSDISKEEFIRVGTTLYKLVNQPRLNGGYVKKRIVWNNETLRQDYGKHYLATVPKYDGFCTVPDHVNYHPIVDKFLNLYEPIDHKPMEGDFPSIRSLVEHIFGEQYELGMDYLQLLYLQPIQKLPILLLVSEERNTGKSTFLNFLKALFQNNVTFNTNEDFRSQFNSDWAGKLLIVVDEVLLSRREDSERLKNLSTTLSYKVEAKGKDRDEIAFFAKFVLCSNNEYLPVIIDAGETRYWVRKIDRLQSDDTDFLQKLKVEIPAFLYHLLHRQLSTEKESRMWFAPSLLHTEALQKIIRSNRNRLEIEICELILDIMASTGIDTFSFCCNDMLTLLANTYVKAEKYQVRKVLQECWKLTPAPNGLTYITYQLNYNRECRYEPIRRVGRFYTVTRQQLETL
ncbi:primase-helicase family protein [uncultured Bacteroides sp.]|uniref:primase-helicase family protein n=1 Tax=uncultured Bacteroides sp. TaxID=162156 RepID=UPI00259987CF|nr:primase-helicase family protein [uncultured Bacteroides sp.]